MACPYGNPRCLASVVSPFLQEAQLTAVESEPPGTSREDKKAAPANGGGEGSAGGGQARRRAMSLYSAEKLCSSTGMTTFMVTGTSVNGSSGSLLCTHSVAS